MKDGRVYYQFEGFSESALLDALEKSGARPSTPRGRPWVVDI